MSEPLRPKTLWDEQWAVTTIQGRGLGFSLKLKQHLDEGWEIAVSVPQPDGSVEIYFKKHLKKR